MKKLKVGKKTGLKYFDIEDVRSWGPCYDPACYLVSGKRYTAVSILQDDRIPFHDRLWVVCRSEVISDKVMRLFAVWCARGALKLVPNPDPRSVNACDIAEKYALGLATDGERDAARDAARDAQKTKLIEMVIAEGEGRAK